MRIVFVSSFIPRKCGIATYTRDLAQALGEENVAVSIIAMKNAVTPPHMHTSVLFAIEEQHKAEYLAAAERINTSNVQIVHIQHEFGIFGGTDGEYILSFAEKLTKPLVVTLHTVVHSPTIHQMYILQELARLSRQVIVMNEIARDRLITIYALNPQDISVIPHGVPSVKGLVKDVMKKELQLENSYMLLISNLVSRNKGIEYAIRAMPKIVQEIPEAKFVIAGETHPNIVLQEGELYREELEKLVDELHMREYILFKNEYVSLDTLRKLLVASDICLTPYLDPEQITSGTLSYAVGAGKVCISTPYIHAENLLADGRGILVDFKNSNAIADAVIDVYKNKKKRITIEKRVAVLGQEMQWKQVALQHTNKYKKIKFSQEYIIGETLQLLKQSPNISYLELLTDQTGITQHAFYSIPEGKFGYSIDDNARALVVASSLYQHNNSKRLLQLIKTYVSYIRFAQESDGTFHNFLNAQKDWIDKSKVGDSFGRTLWALGFAAYSLSETPYIRGINAMLDASWANIALIQDIRSAAYAIEGLSYLVEEGSYGTKRTVTQIRQLADLLIYEFEIHAEHTWQWFEKKMTYDNFRLPLALFAAFKVTSDKKYLKIAEKTLLFAEKNNFDNERKYFDFVGQDGWFEKGKTKAIFDQQSLEAGSAVDAYVFAYTITHKKQYLQKALLAFAWFLGLNRNNRVLYEEKTGGVYDGLTARGINENQGAESVIAFLLAWIQLKKFLKEIQY